MADNMSMAFRHDTWTGGEHYWIRFWKGQHEVRRETPDPVPDNETVFKGHYEACVTWIDNEVAQNYEYDHDI